MSERIEERLRRAAQTYRKLGNHTAEVMFLEAADTLTELRGALQVASVDYRHLSEENAKLRELLDYMTPIAWYAASERERDRMRELGVEVDA